MACCDTLAREACGGAHLDRRFLLVDHVARGTPLLVKLMAAKAWLAVLSLVKLAGSAGLALLADWTIWAAGFYVLAAFVSIWIVVTDELGLEAEQKVCYTFDLRHCAAA